MARTLIHSPIRRKTPFTGPDQGPQGRTLVRVDPATGSIHTLAAPDLQRPIDLCCSPAQKLLYVLDFGSYQMKTQHRLEAQSGKGALHAISVETLHLPQSD